MSKKFSKTNFVKKTREKHVLVNLEWNQGYQRHQDNLKILNKPTNLFAFFEDGEICFTFLLKL